jgi:thiol:disulfide interchange protein
MIAKYMLYGSAAWLLLVLLFVALFVVGHARAQGNPLADPPAKPELVPPSIDVSTETVVYDDWNLAYRAAQVDGKPMLVYIRSAWCLPCERLKRDTLDPMRLDGEFQDVVYVQLDVDENAADVAEIRRRVRIGTAVPQLVYFAGVGKKASRYIVGYTTRDTLRQLIRR